MVSDALCGVVQSSEERLDCSPVSLESTMKEREERLFLSIAPQTSSPALFDDVDGATEGVESPEKGEGLEKVEDEEEDEELRMLLREGDSTVSALVLYKGEKWSKEKLRKWVGQRKRKKLAEFAEMREGRRVAGGRDQLTPDGISRGPKVTKHAYIHTCTSISK